MSDDRAALDQLFQASVRGRSHTLLHYLYFPTKKAAKEVAVILRSQGFRTEERLGADGENWLVLARHEVVPSEETIAAARQMMEELTNSRGAEYDGWEAEVQK
jgi:regulator of ribonuclease activity B